MSRRYEIKVGKMRDVGGSRLVMESRIPLLGMSVLWTVGWGNGDLPAHIDDAAKILIAFVTSSDSILWLRGIFRASTHNCECVNGYADSDSLELMYGRNAMLRFDDWEVRLKVIYKWYKVVPMMSSTWRKSFWIFLFSRRCVKSTYRDLIRELMF